MQVIYDYADKIKLLSVSKSYNYIRFFLKLVYFIACAVLASTFACLVLSNKLVILELIKLKLIGIHSSVTATCLNLHQSVKHLYVNLPQILIFTITFIVLLSIINVLLKTIYNQKKIILKNNFLQKELLKQKEIVSKLASQTHELEISLNELNQFSTVISHDLQVPLATISGYADLIQARHLQAMDSEAKEFFQYINDNARFMRNLITDLHKYSKVNFQLTDLEKIDLDSLVNSVIDSLQSLVINQHAKIEYEPLPSVYGQPSLLSQVFLNLIANGIKFNTKPKPLIKIMATQKNNYWLFNVQDNGIGIDLQADKDIFNIFKRGSNANDFPGTGVGLAICKKIIMAHFGQIWAESKPGLGSTFYFTLPIK